MSSIDPTRPRPRIEQAPVEALDIAAGGVQVAVAQGGFDVGQLDLVLVHAMQIGQAPDIACGLPPSR